MKRFSERLAKKGGRTMWIFKYILAGYISILEVVRIITWRLNRQLRLAGLDPASSVFLDSRLRGNDSRRVFNRRSNNNSHAKTKAIDI